MATHSSVLAWRVPGTGEPGGLLSMGSHRVGHDWSDLAAAADISSNLALFYVWEDARVCTDWNHSFAVHLSCLGPASCAFSSWVSSGCVIRVAPAVNCYEAGILFESWVPSGLTIRVAVMRWLDDCNILFTDTTESIFFSLMRAQSRMLEWVAMPYSRGSSHPRDWTHISFVSCIGRQIVYHYSEKEFILFPLYLPEKGRTVVLGCNIKK